MFSVRVLLILACFLVVSAIAHAHDGRRFEIRVVDGQLVAQGVNTGAADGAPATRPYASVIHDHWQNSPLGLEIAIATLPGFDVPAPTDPLLVGQPLFLTLIGVRQWANPPVMPSAGIVPQLSLLSGGETVSITAGGMTIDSTNLGTLPLLSSAPVGGASDIDVLYSVNSRPTDSIYVLSATISSGSAFVADSEPVSIVLSPDGSNAMERLHHASLYLEQFLGPTAVPEPSSLVLAVAALTLLSISSTNLSGR